MKDFEKIPLVMRCMLEDFGFAYVCYEADEGLHYMQKRVTHIHKISQDQLDQGYQPVPEQRYAVVRCNNEDITNGNLHFFLVRGYTR